MRLAFLALIFRLVMTVARVFHLERRRVDLLIAADVFTGALDHFDCIPGLVDARIFCRV
ncbi:MAG: hypothetical protein KJO95_12170 [Gammaproteobacteria bacterium]|nr:hypothetical protein [Gammaproteobacteria bacterium]